MKGVINTYKQMVKETKSSQPCIMPEERRACKKEKGNVSKAFQPTVSAVSS